MNEKLSFDKKRSFWSNFKQEIFIQKNISKEKFLSNHDLRWGRRPGGKSEAGSAAGRSDYVVTGPYQMMTAFDARELTQVHNMPAGLLFSAGDYPVITFLVFNQYSGPVEPIYPSWRDPSSLCKPT